MTSASVASAWSGARPCISTCPNTCPTRLSPPASTAARHSRSASATSRAAQACSAAVASRSSEIGEPPSSRHVAMRIRSSRRRAPVASKPVANARWCDCARTGGHVARNRLPYNGCPSRTTVRRPDDSTRISARVSRSSSASSCTSDASRSSSAGSEYASSSRASRCDGSSRPRFSRTSSPSRPPSSIAPCHDQMPPASRNDPTARPEATSSLRYKGFPSLPDHSNDDERESSGPSSARSSSSSDSARVRSPSGYRSSSPSCHSSARSPGRDVTNTRACP